MITEKGETTTSFLLIKGARPSDSGQYQCNPSNAKSKSVMVHVLNGKYLKLKMFHLYKEICGVNNFIYYGKHIFFFFFINIIFNFISHKSIGVSD